VVTLKVRVTAVSLSMFISGSNRGWFLGFHKLSV